MKSFIRDNVGDLTFKEAYLKTGKILNVTVSGVDKYDADRVLNYLTAPNIVIWSAVGCSCSIPFGKHIILLNTLFSSFLFLILFILLFFLYLLNF